MKLFDQIGKWPRHWVISAGVAMVALLGFVDYITGPELAFSIFYLIPICSVSWFAGRKPGLFISFLCAVAWLLAELLWTLEYKYAFVPWWNASVRLGLFSVSGALTAEVAERKRAELALRNQTNILQSILNSMGDGVIVADTNGTILMFNPAAERLLNTRLSDRASAEWLAQHETYLPDMLTAYPPGEHPLLRAIRGEPVNYAEMFLRRDGVSSEGTWLAATGRPFLDDKGALRGGVLVFTDITPRKLLEKQIAEISDREQHRIGQDLHDGLCQQLVSTAFACSLLQGKLLDKGLQEAKSAEAITDMINQAISQGRDLARGLYPVRLEDEGLASALEELAEGVQNLSKINCEFKCENPVTIFDPVAGSNLFRIAQEAVNNAVKHSQCRKIMIELEAVDDEITLIVSDDGVGFPGVEKGGKGMGLSIMNYRARMTGANLDVRRGAHGGTVVSCSFINSQPVKKI